MLNFKVAVVLLVSGGLLVACGDDTGPGGGGEAQGGQGEGGQAQGGGGAEAGGAGGEAACDAVCATCDVATSYTSECFGNGADKSRIQATCEQNLSEAEAACQVAYDAYAACWDIESCTVPADCDDELAAAEDACGKPVSFY